MKTKLLLLDVDGTILLSGGAGKRALESAFELLHGAAGAMSGVGFAGRTDPAIVREMYRLRLDRDPTAGELHALFEAYLPRLEEEVAVSRGFTVMPGVPELLALVAERDDVCLGLVTGNLERAARIKLERPGLARYFRYGGFGSDSEDRPALTRKGIERGRALAARSSDGATPPVGPLPAIVVGDTPADVRAGRAAGAFTIAVATGGSTIEALAAEGPDLVLRDLTDPAPLIDLLDAD